MKHNANRRNMTVYHPNRPAYPNAADNSYFTGKALNIITAIVSGMGFVSAMLFLVTMA